MAWGLSKKTLRDRLVGYLSRRDHSRRELERKLKPHAASPEEIQETIQWADDLQLLKPEAELSETFARWQHSRLKSHRQLQLHLRDKGLSAPPVDEELELKKALDLVRKWGKAEPDKIYRRLAYRGFAPGVIRTAVRLIAKKDST